MYFNIEKKLYYVTKLKRPKSRLFYKIARTFVKWVGNLYLQPNVNNIISFDWGPVGYICHDPS